MKPTLQAPAAVRQRRRVLRLHVRRHHPLANGGWISAGVQVARNTLDTALEVRELEDGMLVPREVFNADQTIRELRV